MEWESPEMPETIWTVHWNLEARLGVDGRGGRWDCAGVESNWWMRELQSIAAAKKVGDGSLAVPPSYDPLVYKWDMYIPRGSPGTTDMESKTPKTGTTYLGT